MTRDIRLNGILLGVGLVGLGLACLLGSTTMSAGRVFAALLGGGLPTDQIVVQSIRLPRAVSAWLVGAALGISGAALQGLLRNPLAEPGVLGVTATSSLFATVAIYFGLAAIGAWVIPVAAIAGAMVATALIAALALRTRSVVTLILVGVALSAFAGAAMSLLLNLAPNPFSLADMINWTLGSVANRSATDIWQVLPFIGAGVALLWLTRQGLSALTLGEDAAAGLGLDLRRQRLAVVIGAGLATGGSVALAGAIGFVGIVAPHLVRPWVDSDPARTLLPSALLGGAVLLFADIAIRIAPTSSELKLGVVAALIGAPLFAWIAAQRRPTHG